MTMNTATDQRPVVLHYHLFKNAGSSLDALFKAHFGDAWVTAEFPGDPLRNRAGLKEWIATTPAARCYSTHTGSLPTPEIDGVSILPVIFVRHPLDRIASAYAFESRQGDPGFGSTLARHTSLAGYVETRLSIPGDRQVRNFHVDRFSRAITVPAGTDLDRALEGMSSMPFVGVVEEFGRSLEILQGLLAEHGLPGVKLESVRRNVSTDRAAKIEDRLAELSEEVGAETYAKLLEANADDIRLYEAAVARLQALG
jgi:hypothetical protein